ncbi:S-adenosyl-L-methionine-dependent methyltransferase [Pseudomassariella vexata]|uniref:S-adenosyl-L-methionine-dependent methyltransferase n=1 Tax=Pseudomassariella vexata TaxID=1141098 RepID=A0A1Y2DYH8_9PEZI|nr:S-adenosyl-L-methionine-dependent methyltransferase [Pseudomassariella vexata]ORY64360.1 S-adenosyl-L-methionine-dependent methyltransferase [Pseudomassariella vexata]
MADQNLVNRDVTSPDEVFGQFVPQTGVEQGTNQDIIDELEVDSNRADSDSGLGSELSTTSTSLGSRVLPYRYQNGRRYQASNDIYHLPNDVQEMNRLELQHMIFIEMLGHRLHLAPIDKIKMTHALDVGCGTANWSIEFAELYPHVQVIGTDLSPIQPRYAPSNCTFYIDDATKEWMFYERFDYIHLRALTMGITDWDKLVDQAYKHLQPGGYLELQEFHMPLESSDGSLKPDSALATWGRNVQEICGRLGINVKAALEHPDRLRQRGFQAVEEAHLPVPIGPWAKGLPQKRIGWMARKDLYEGIDAISRRLLLMMDDGQTEEQVDALLAQCKEEIMDRSIHSYMTLDVTWGQRPFDG